MTSRPSTVVVLGTGGTIAGTAAHGGDNVGYSAAQLSVHNLLAALPELGAQALEAEQVAQLDSKDMDLAVLRRLVGRIGHHLARPEVAGVVVTHGTDTLEETAHVLQRTLAAGKPVVLTAAMRPASSRQADGPQNLLDAVSVVRQAAAAGQGGVVAVMAGRVWPARWLRKGHSYRIEAFGAGDAGPLGWMEEGRLVSVAPWPVPDGLGEAAVPADDAQAPWVALLTSHAGASGREVDALVAAGVQGIALACTGNGSVHHALEQALQRAQAAGVAVLRATRCAAGGIVGEAPSPFPSAGALTPAQARLELVMQLAGRSG